MVVEVSGLYIAYPNFHVRIVDVEESPSGSVSWKCLRVLEYLRRGKSVSVGHQ